MERRQAAGRAVPRRSAQRGLASLLDPTSVRKAFNADPAGLAAEVVHVHGERLSTIKLKAAVVQLGVDKASVDAAWQRIRTGLQKNPNISVDKQWYAWRAPETTPKTTPKPAPETAPDAPPEADPVHRLEQLTPAEALARLAERDSLPPPVRQALAQAVRAGLGGAPPSAAPAHAPAVAPHGEVAQLRSEKARLEAMLRDTHHQQVSFRAAQDRQLRIDSIRTLAEMAIEVEELAANGAEAEVIIERVRALAEINELEPIGQVGQSMAYDPAQHRPLAGQPDTGSAVSVVRPGYTWHAEDDDVLLEKAIVG